MRGPGKDKDFWEVYWMGRGQGLVAAISQCPDSLVSSKPFTVKTHLGLATGRQNISLLCYSATSGLFWLVRFRIQSFRNKITKDYRRYLSNLSLKDSSRPRTGAKHAENPLLRGRFHSNYKQHWCRKCNLMLDSVQESLINEPWHSC